MCLDETNEKCTVTQNLAHAQISDVQKRKRITVDSITMII